MKLIASALVKIQANLKGARKTKENPHLRSKYADLASVWEACHEALTENEVVVVQAPVFRDGQMFCQTTLMHSSGESLEGFYLIRPVKDDPQAYGSAFTYARRYSLCGMLGITNEDDDGHRATTRGKVADIGKVKDQDVISSAERIALRKIWLKAGKTDDMVAAYLREAYDVDSTAKLKKSEYQEVALWCAEPKPTAGA